jgi:lipopolysaccharide export LptBFGC system permease protein LptF
VIADLQFEYRHAVADGSMWRARWQRVIGYAAFWRTLSLCAARATVIGTRAWAAADSHPMRLTLGYSAVIIASLTFLLALLTITPVLQRSDVQLSRALLLYIIPSAIPVAMAFGLPIGILLGLRGRPVTSRTRRSVIGLAAVCGALAFVVCGWVLPEANQAFRQSLFNSHSPGLLARGANELTFGDLNARLAALKRYGWLEETSPLLFSYHARLAASAAPLIWGVFALVLSSMTRRTVFATTAVVVAGITYIAVAIVIIDERWITSSWLPLAYVIWLPNVLFALMTVALWFVRSKSSEI